MAFQRTLVRQSGLQRLSRAGDGWLTAVRKVVQAADSAQVLGIDAISGGVYVRTSITAGRTDTTDTAANLAAAFPDMDIGDSIMFLVGNTSGQTLTIAGGTSVTASGNLLVLTLTSKWFVLTKTAAATFDLVGL
jgi:hypothetical protein